MKADRARTLSRCGRAARIYAAEFGWRVFPLHGVVDGACTCGRDDCGGPGKHPRTTRGCLDATRDPATIETWWTRWPDAHVGVATGDGLVVIDVDPRHGGDDSLVDLRRELGPLPDTVEALTGGGGRHIYLRASAAVRNSASALGPGIDVRGEGGYVVAPPSSHVSGKAYGWESSSRPEIVEVAEAPRAWLDAMLRRPKLRAIPGGRGEAFPEGERNTSLYKRACSMRAAGCTAQTIIAALLVENDERCMPPLDPAEVKAIAESAARHPEGLSPEYRERQERAAARRAATEQSATTETPAADAPETESTGTGWEQALVRSRGRVVNSFANLCTILRCAPRYAGRITWNEMAFAVCYDARPTTDGDIGRWREALEREFGISPGPDSIRLAAQTVAEEHRVHPVKTYLLGLSWDGVRRIDNVAASILGATEPLAAKLLRRWFVAAVARAMRPGCKVDCALVLVGPQGARKSTFYQVLAGEWFTDTHVDLSSKDAFLQLAGAWVVEWGEIERVTGRRGADEIKSFMSSRVDRFRPPYGRSIVEVPRTCVVVGSTNQSTFLDDDTGSRRFWCVRVPGGVAIDALREQRDQLWAEAVAAFEDGEPWWLDADDELAREIDAEAHAVDDSWDTRIAAWAQTHRGAFTADEILKGALGLEARDQGQAATKRMGRALRRIGWERRKGRPLREGRQLPPAWLWWSPAADGAALDTSTEAWDE